MYFVIEYLDQFFETSLKCITASFMSLFCFKGGQNIALLLSVNYLLDITRTSPFSSRTMAYFFFFF